MKLLERPVPVPSQPQISVGKKLAFSICTCVLTFAGVEIAGRIANGWNESWTDCHRYHEVLGWCLREGWVGDSDWTAGPGRINPQGLRDDRPVGLKGLSEKRLLILGDSVTFGGKVRTDEAYPARLENELSESGHHWRVLNAGVASYDPSQEGDWLELFGWPLGPDALAIGFCRNDVEPSQRSTQGGDKAGELPSSFFGRWLTEHSITAYRFQRFLWHQQASLARAGVRAGLQPLRSSEPSGWPFVEAAYRKIADSARQHHTPVILIVFPTLPLLQGKRSDDLSERLQHLGHELGWEVIDVAAAMRDDPASLFCEGDDFHPNAAGYARAASYICESILRRDLLH